MEVSDEIRKNLKPTSKPDPRVFFRSKVFMGLDGEKTSHEVRRTYRRPVDPNGRPQGKAAIKAAKRARVKELKAKA